MVELQFDRTWSFHFQDIRCGVLDTTRLLSPEMALVSVAAAAWISVGSTSSLDLAACLSQGGPYALPGLIGGHGGIQESMVEGTSFEMQG